MPPVWRPPTPPWTEDVARKSEAAQRLIGRIAVAHPNATFATSLQIEDAVVTDLIARAGAKIDLFMLETGRLAEETLEAKQAIQQRYGLEIAAYKPDPAEVAAWVARHGQDGFYEGVELRKACCAMRKVRPLARALTGRTAWITGQRREQAQSRADLREQEFDDAHGIEKYNPLADWTLDDVWAYARARDLPVNALYARGYASIGCDPCTRAIRADEDVRAGRWWWEANNSKECGLHVAEAPALTS